VLCSHCPLNTCRLRGAVNGHDLTACKTAHSELGRLINHVLESMKNLIPLDIVVGKIMLDHAKVC
jgi:hypothetical protein